VWGEFYQLPLGIGYIASAIENAGHEVLGLNLNHVKGEISKIVEDFVRKEKPNVLASGGLSVFLDLLSDIFTSARKGNPDIVNIGGGGVVGGEPGVILDALDIDYGIIGEGEHTIVHLLELIDQARFDEMHTVQGIVFRTKNKKTQRTGERTQEKKLEKFFWPNYELLDVVHNIKNQRPLDQYFFQAEPNNNPRSIDMISSRSCPFKCTFCFHPTGKTYRERPFDDFFAELKILKDKFNVNMVAIVDELFSLKRRRLLEFCEQIKKFDVKWMVQLHVNSACDETIKAMKDSGCVFISYGIESMSQPILESMQKKSRVPRIQEALDLTYEYKIGIQGNLLFGDSAETLETANESLYWWSRNRHFQINLTPLIVFPGSPDYLEALRDGLIEDEARLGFIKDIPVSFNISSMNDENINMLRLQVWIFARSLLMMAKSSKMRVSAEKHPERGNSHDFEFDCPRCGTQNEYRDTIIPLDAEHTTRVTCRSCLNRWDIENTTYISPQTKWQKIDHFGIIQKIALTFGRQLLKSKKFSLFHKVYNRLQGVFAYNPEFRYLMADFYQLTGNKQEMLKATISGAGMTPLDPLMHLKLSNAFCEINALGAAKLHLDQAIQLGADNKETEKQLQKIKGIQGNTPDNKLDYFVSWSDVSPPKRVNWLKDAMALDAAE
jgi:radical SAM superfamily enzyme YgiQ (UPF0313 family)